MNWETIKNIYRCVLVHNCKFEYLGEDKYKLIFYYPSGEKHWETEYQNIQRHGKNICYKNGQKHWEKEYKNGRQIK